MMETNNKMRQALEATNQFLESAIINGKVTSQDITALRNIVSAARSEPVRNCDVGTPDEQAERFEDFCLKHIGCAEETGGRHCVGCPLEKASEKTTQKCELYWAQLPYVEKEGVAE